MMRATLNNHTPINHEDTIRILDRRQSVRDSDGSAAFSSFVESCLDDFFGLGVKG